MKYVKHVKKDSQIKLTDKVDINRKCEFDERLDTEDVKPKVEDTRDEELTEG